MESKEMTSGPAPLFDRQLLRRRRERFAPQLGEHDFLLRRAAEEMLFRMGMVQREFATVLELGAGHGLLAEGILQRPDSRKLILADSSPALLAPLRERLGEWSGNKSVQYMVIDEEGLTIGEGETLEEGSVNLVMALLSLHFVNDLPATLSRIRALLAPDGLFMAALPGGRTLYELRECFAQAETELYGGASPHIAPMADIRDYGNLLIGAGFTLPVADSDFVRVSYGDPLKMMAELRAMSGGNVLSERRKGTLDPRLIRRVAEIYERDFVIDGRIEASFEIIHLLGWSPHESQPKPLAPGSVPPGFCARPLPPQANDDDG